MTGTDKVRILEVRRPWGWALLWLAALIPFFFLTYTFANAEGGGIPALLRRLGEIGVDFTDLETSTSTLEDIFVGLIGRAA